MVGAVVVAQGQAPRSVSAAAGTRGDHAQQQAVPEGAVTMAAAEKWKLEWVDPKTLQAHPDNYNRHPEEQLQTLDETIEEFGVYSPIIVSSDGYVLCHEGVTTAALRTKQGQVPIRRMEFAHDTPQARALMVADNETRRQSEPDADQLSQLLTSLESDGLLQLTGHDEASLSALLEQVANAAAPTGFVPPEFREYDENIDLSNVKRATCPECGHEFPV